MEEAQLDIEAKWKMYEQMAALPGTENK